MDQHYNKITEILKSRIGLDSSTIGERTVEKILMQRMMVCKIDSVDEYYLHLNSHPDELDELLEFAVIPETWFFRDIRPFEILQQQIGKALLENRNSIFNILSIPCSTGEEPLSIAMYLIDKGLPESCFQIDAVDISHRAIDYAARGIYGKNSFRGKNYPHYQNRFFTKQGDLYKIAPEIHNKVEFSQLNILNCNETLESKYDFILCRNLLIYFDSPTKSIAFRNLSQLLNDTGLLFIGHSEFGSVPREIFQSLGSTLAFALTRHENPNYIDASTTAKTSNEPVKKIGIIAAQKKASFSAYIQSEKNQSQLTDAGISELLCQAEALANIENYFEAEKLCQQAMQLEKDNEHIFYLLGLIASGKKDNDIAESMMRKAIFLNPKHYPALSHLSLLLEKKGDAKNAELFRQRASRAQSRNQADN